MCKYLIMKIFIVRGRLNHVRLWYGKINKAPEKRGEFWGPWAVVFYCMHIFCFFSLFTSKCCIEFDLCQHKSWNFIFFYVTNKSYLHYLNILPNSNFLSKILKHITMFCFWCLCLVLKPKDNLKPYNQKIIKNKSIMQGRKNSF